MVHGFTVHALPQVGVRDIYDFDTAGLDLDYEVDPGRGLTKPALNIRVCPVLG